MAAQKNSEDIRMKGITSTNIIMAFSLAAFVSMGLATSAYSAGPVARASSEQATGGLTPEEYREQQLQLHEWLMSELPDGTLNAPIRVPLTKSDRRAIGNDSDTVPAPASRRHREAGGALRRTLARRSGLEGFAAARARRHARDGRRWVYLGGGGRSPRARPRCAFICPTSLCRTAPTSTSSPWTGRLTGRTGEQDAFWSNSVMGPEGIVLVRQFGRPPAGAGPMSVSVSSVGNLGQAVRERRWPHSANTTPTAPRTQKPMATIS